MTNRIALALGLLLLIGVASDVILNDSENLIFLGKKLFDLTEWMAFWR